MFKVGQLVYLRSKITGWFDRSANHYLPEGTPGTIMKVLQEADEFKDTVYLVQFGEEFGDLGVHHSKLRVEK